MPERIRSRRRSRSNSASAAIREAINLPCALSIVDRVAVAQNSRDFPRLPVDDARQDQGQAAAGVHLLPQLAGIDPTPPP